MRIGAWRILSLLVLLAAFAVVGCSGRPKLAEVKGTVKLDGKPLSKIMVEFIPDAPTGPRSTGSTDENGQYTLICDDQRPGAVIGPHRVVLHDLQVYGDKVLGRKWERVGVAGGPPAKPSRISSQYADTNQTPLKKEVQPEPQTIDLDVKGP